MLKDTGHHGPQKFAKGPPVCSYPFTLPTLLLYKYKNTMYFLFCVVLKISIQKNMPNKLYPQTKCISLLLLYSMNLLDIKYT